MQNDLKGIYQDEMTGGFERALDPTFSMGVRYTYRNLGRTIEDRCDLDPGYPENHQSECAIFNPGSDSPYSTGEGIHGCDGRNQLGSAGNPEESRCQSPAVYPAGDMPTARRRYHGLELVARKQLKDVLFLQASYLYSRLRGNYDGMASNTFGAGGGLFLDRPHSFRLDAAYTARFGLGVGVQAFLRSGAPISLRESFRRSSNYTVFATPRGSEGRQPWDYELNLQLQYALRLRGVTVTAFGQCFNLLDRQTVLDTDQRETNQPDDTFPSYRNPEYGKATSRRARVSF